MDNKGNGGGGRTMMQIKEEYRAKIVEAMTSAGTYTPQLDLIVDNFASAFACKALCEIEMSAPDFKMIVDKETRDGLQPIENPILKPHARYTTQIDRFAKQLNITVADLVGKPDIPTPADELVNMINNIR